MEPTAGIVLPMGPHWKRYLFAARGARIRELLELSILCATSKISVRRRRHATASVTFPHHWMNPHGEDERSA